MNRKVFTLVELLTVVVIIVILASILMPVLKRARYTALVSACGSNIRQIAVAYAAYTSDNDMYYPRNGTMRTNNEGFMALDTGAFGGGASTKKIIAPYFDVTPPNYGVMDKVFMCPLVSQFAGNYKSYNVFAAANCGQDAGTVGDGTGPTPIVYKPDGGGILTDGWAGKLVTGESSATVNRHFRPIGGFMLKVGQPWYSKTSRKYYNLLISDYMNGWSYSRRALHHELQADFQESTQWYYLSPKEVYPTAGGNFAAEDGSVNHYVAPGGGYWKSSWNKQVDSTPDFDRVGSMWVHKSFEVDAP